MEPEATTEALIRLGRSQRMCADAYALSEGGLRRLAGAGLRAAERAVWRHGAAVCDWVSFLAQHRISG